MTLTEEYTPAIAHDRSAAVAVDLPSLVACYSPLLFRVAYSVLRNHSEAEDVVQDVFLRVLQHRSRLESIQDMRVWLVRIAWNLAIDRTRRRKPQQIDDPFLDRLISQTIPADEVLVEMSRMARVLRELDRLPRAEREVLLLSAMDELGTAAAAQVLGRSESATRALLFRARTRLKKRLAQGDGK